MKRRSFFKSVAMAGVAASATVKESSAYLVAHNWDKYDFGSGPPVKNRLNQGPFPQYPPEALFPGSDVVMTTVAFPGARTKLRPRAHYVSRRGQRNGGNYR